MKKKTAGRMSRHQVSPVDGIKQMLVLLIGTIRETVSPVQKAAIMERWEHKLVQEGLFTVGEVMAAAQQAEQIDTPA